MLLGGGGLTLSRSIVTVGKRVITFEFVISPTLCRAQPTNLAGFDRRPPMKTWLRSSLESEVWSRIPETSWGGRGMGVGSMVVHTRTHTHTH